jgi:hypothetical protein
MKHPLPKHDWRKYGRPPTDKRKGDKPPIDPFAQPSKKDKHIVLKPSEPYLFPLSRAEEYYRREQVAAKLWAEHTKDIHVRYPDPSVTVQVLTRVGEIEIRTIGNRDTRDQSVRLGSPFSIIGRIGSGYWPGRQAARDYVACLWAALLLHEALELVTARGSHMGDHQYPKAEKRILDPHTDFRHAPLVNREIHSVPECISAILGWSTGENLVAQFREEATRDMDEGVVSYKGPVRAWRVECPTL